MKKRLKKEQMDEIRAIFKDYVKTLREEGYTYRQIRKLMDEWRAGKGE